MPKKMTNKQKKTAFIGVGMIAFFLIITILVLPLHILSSFADTNDPTANSNDPFVQFCGTYYNVNTSTLGSGPLDKYNDCLGLSTPFQSYLQAHTFAYGGTPVAGTTPPVAGTTPTTVGTTTPVSGATPTTVGSTPTTVESTPTVEATPTGTTEQPLCSCVPTPTATSVPGNPTPVSTNVPVSSGTATPVVTGTPTGTVTGTNNSWPSTSLVALENANNASKVGNAVLSADVAHTENNFTAYVQQQEANAGAQQSSYQAALSNWTNDPLLQLALVSYTKNATTGQVTYADATNNNPSFTSISTLIATNPIEVASIQVDLAPKVKSTTYQQTGVDCSFSGSSLTQAYHACLGTDTLFDLLYSERYTGSTTPVLYNTVATILESEFTGKVKTYVQEASSATTAQSAYTYIASLTDQHLKETIIDHLLSGVVKNVQQTLCPTPTSGVLTPAATGTPSSVLTPEATETPSGVLTPIETGTPSSVLTPEATGTPSGVLTPTSVVQTPEATTIPCVTPTSVAQPTPTGSNGATPTSIAQTPVATPCIGRVPMTQQIVGPIATPCDSPVSGAQTPEATTTPCVTPTNVATRNP